MKPFKEAVSLVIISDDNNFLAVKRPDDPNDDLAGIWGFPAVTLKEGESHQEAATRVGRQKLGVEIELGERIGDSTHDRGTYTLHLTDYKAKVVRGEPRAPQKDKSVTQYSECKYSDDPKIVGVDWKSAEV
jgi:8-oxo-dGTP diphosphatase